MTPFRPEEGLVVIPARAGSKRVPGKNLKSLGGYPLLAWSIRAARACPRLGRIFVSTDSEEYAQVARSFGAEVPFLRSSRTASDEASTKDVIVEAVDRYGADLGFHPTWIVILQPTSPFRSPILIEKGVGLLEESDGLSVIAVARQKIPRAWMVDLDGQGFLDEKEDAAAALPKYSYCGSFYAFTAKTLREKNDLYTERVRALVVEDLAEALDIDTPEEWRLAERLAAGFAPSLFGGPAPRQ